MRSTYTTPLSAAALAALFILLCLHGWTSPQGAPGPGALSSSVATAERDLAAIAGSQRSLGSPGHDLARQHLLGESRALGLETVERRLPVARRLGSGPVVAAVVENVVAVLRGRSPKTALLVVSHYDSVPNSYGAGDNAAALTAMLATMRSLHAGPPLRNDVIFLFSDGEEEARLGAEAFLRHDPEASRVAVVLNFDGRGSSGPPILFETGDANGWALSQFTGSGAPPLATSVSNEVYRRLPNDTDFSVFRAAGLPGLNFAAIDGYEHYHSVLDDLAHLNRATVVEYTDTMLRLTRTFADADLSAPRAASWAYVGLPGGLLARYPLRWCFGVACLAWALVVACIGYRRRSTADVRPAAVLKSAAWLFVALVLIFVATSKLWWCLRPFPDTRGLPQDGIYASRAFVVGFVLLSTTALWSLLVLLRRQSRRPEILAGAALLSATLGVVAGWLAPGASYLFVVAAVAPAIALSLEGRWRQSSWPAAVIAALAGFAVALVAVPIIYLLHVALGPAGLPVVSVLSAWLAGFGFTLPPLDPQNGFAPSRNLAASAALVGVLALVIARSSTHFDAVHPRPDALLRLSDDAHHTSVWASTDPELDAFTTSVLGPAARRDTASQYLPELARPIWVADAPYIDRPRVEATLVRDFIDQGRRNSVVEVRPRMPVDVIDLRFGTGLRPTTLVVQGMTLELSPVSASRWLQFWAPPSDGFQVTIVNEGAGRLELSTVARSFRVEEDPRLRAPGRPAGFMPLPFGFDAGDMTASRADHAF